MPYTYTHNDATERTVNVRRQLWDGTTFRIEYEESIGTFSGPMLGRSITGDLAAAFWDQYNSDEALIPVIDLATGQQSENDLRTLYGLEPIDEPDEPELPPGM